ncbi:MAG: DUF3962 domain-containing protein [Oscillatoria sp. SIO1A7]|nr:DUF3962 domain-containing protein [Oscillatoria sp. SIO1A7]
MPKNESKPKVILPGAWELTNPEVERELFRLYVPEAWQDAAKYLTKQRAKQGGYRSVPVRSLDPLVAASFPQLIYTGRQSWQKPNIPWLVATEKADLSNLPILIKDWLREEFSYSIEEQEIESVLKGLNDEDWQWADMQSYSLLNPPKSQEYLIYKVFPDYIAQEFLKNPTVKFGHDEDYKLTFYRVVSLDGAELMSWPPQAVTVGKGEKGEKEEKVEQVYVSFVIGFRLHTVPGREKPMIYHSLSVRRWINKPLIIEKNGEPTNFVRYPGVTVHIGDRYRWLDGKQQPFSFLPVKLLRQGQDLKWPRAIANLLVSNSSNLPDPQTLAGSEPDYSQSGMEVLQAAIAHTSKLGKTPCLPGISPLDLARLDKAIEEKLPVRRVGEAILVRRNKSFWSKNDSKVMLDPNIAGPAFRDAENPIDTILILWKNEKCRDALIEEICKQLSLSPTLEDGVYSGNYGSLRIQTQYVDDLTDNLDVAKKNRQQKRTKQIEERSKRIKSSLPAPKGLSGAIVEIKPKPRPPEADAKLACRIGVMQAGYVNQHILPLTYINKQGEEKFKRDYKQRVKRAVSDLLRQFGVLPAPLIDKEIDGIDPNIWLTCFYILRRTRKTTAKNVPNTVALMVRVNPVLGKAEFTTPSLFKEKGRWVSSAEIFQRLLKEKWEPNSYADSAPEEANEEEKPEAIKKEKQLMERFVGDCLRDCLHTPIEDEKSPRVLFMADAQNARSMLPWLQNPNLPANDLPDGLKRIIDNPSETDRLWIVRVRTKQNQEVPVGIVKDDLGARTRSIYRWEGVSDNPETPLYLSARKPLNTEQGVLGKDKSRLDNGSAPAGNPPLLEIAVVHHPGIERDDLAFFVHGLRARWPYFTNEVSRPFPFPLAIKAKEYAVSAKDSVEFDGSDEEE